MIRHFWSKKVKLLKNNKIIKLLFQISNKITYWMKNLIPHPRSTIFHTFDGSYYTKKWEIHKKRDCNHAFLCISHFSCSRTHRKYATWVLLGWGIKFFIQRVLPLKIWVKTLGDKLKIWVEKVVFSFFPLKFDDVIKSYLIFSTIIL